MFLPDFITTLQKTRIKRMVKAPRLYIKPNPHIMQLQKRKKQNSRLL